MTRIGCLSDKGGKYTEDKTKENGFGRIMIPDAYDLNLMCIFEILNLICNEQNYF